MTIKEALKEICDKQIPKEVNGVSTKYVIHEYSSDLGNKVVEVSVLPTNITKNDIGVTWRHHDEYYMNFDCCRASFEYDRLGKNIRDLLCWYIRNIIEWTDGRVVREIRLDLEGDSNDQP
jgi:hypothetical protein